MRAGTFTHLTSIGLYYNVMWYNIFPSKKCPTRSKCWLGFRISLPSCTCSNVMKTYEQRSRLAGQNSRKYLLCLWDSTGNRRPHVLHQLRGGSAKHFLVLLRQISGRRIPNKKKNRNNKPTLCSTSWINQCWITSAYSLTRNIFKKLCTKIHVFVSKLSVTDICHDIAWLAHSI